LLPQNRPLNGAASCAKPERQQAAALHLLQRQSAAGPGCLRS
jgi:hypothetical protein